MTVSSARVQKIVKGDDVVLTHQIVDQIALEAEVSIVPIEVNTGDTVNFFYPLEDSTVTDLIGYPGVPVGSLPASVFTVAIPGLIIEPSLPNRGTSQFQSGSGRTVRAEITRLKATVTGNCDGVTGIITDVIDIADVIIGMSVVGAGIPPLAIVIAVNPNNFQFTISANTLSVQVGVSLALGQKETHYNIDEVDIFERGFPSSLTDTSGGEIPPQPSLNLT